MYKYILVLFLMGVQVSAQNKVRVYLLGTYHMAGTSDALGVDLTKDNILGEKRQQEINILLGRLEKGKVEKIYVENPPVKQVYWDSIYKLHYTGKPVVNRNEIFQIGIKLAGRLGIKQGVTCVDWHQYDGKSRSEILFAEYCMKMSLLIDSLKIDEEQEFTAYDKYVLKELDELNSQIPAMDLVSVFKTINSKDYLYKFFYGNITTYLDKNTEGLGAFWSQYNMMRNANIYSNIMKDILTTRPERVLILYGAGHIQALKDMFEAHPVIEVVDINTLLGE